MTVEVPTFIPLPEAARRFGIAEKVLTRLIQDGIIRAIQLPDGRPYVLKHPELAARRRTKRQTRLAASGRGDSRRREV